ncbi:MAG: DUF3021 domain-containing protein [Lachnospiraceae bacterium]|jgi:hypothetical protein|nr:DUF3021 domain-containing protein [Lachnospiraceae bacterium]
MSVKVTLKTVFFLFCGVNTALVFFVGLQGVLFVEELSFSGWDMLKLISVAFASSLPTLVFAGQEAASRRRVIFLRTTHFILTAGTVFALLILYGMIDTSNAIYVSLIFLVIYIVAYIVIELRAKKLADKLNERINAFHNSENETH